MDYKDKRTPLEVRITEIEVRVERHHLEDVLVETYNSPIPDHYLIEE